MKDTCGHNCRKLRDYVCSACTNSDNNAFADSKVIIEKILASEHLKLKYKYHTYNNNGLFVVFVALKPAELNFILDIEEVSGIGIKRLSVNRVEIRIFSYERRGHEPKQ